MKREIKKSAKNDNLVKYREIQKERNEALVLKAITHIQKLNGDISFSLVSKVTYDLADAEIGEKGLTLAGITKNQTYRAMIEKAKVSSTFHQTNQYTHSKQSIGDIRLALHTLRVENSKLKTENKILSTKLLEADIPIREVGAVDEEIIKQAKAIQSICNSITKRLLELELAYIDLNSFTLKVAIYDETIASYEALNLFFKKELDEIKSKI